MTQLQQATKFCGIGVGLKTKVNANIGTSPDYVNVEVELEKLKASVDAGADAVIDLSTGGDLRAIRRKIIESSSITVGSVPIYEAAVKAVKNKQTIVNMTASDMLDAVRLHCEDGVDFITVHCGATKGVLKHLKDNKRICGVVSRGGTFLVEWMIHSGKENPLYEKYDEILAIAKEYDVTISLGDAMRPGALADAFDRAQVYELNVLAELAQRALAADVQVMVEGPGHVPMNQVVSQVQLQKELCKGVPFYVLGPIVTDIAPGYDHITSAMGGALAAYFGADFLCYVTPSEHLRLPTLDEVKEGVIAEKIAAHAADLAKGVKGAIEMDNAISIARKKRDWKKQIACSIDPKKAKEYRQTSTPISDDVCTMCNKYCSIKLFEEATSKGRKQ